MTSLTEQLQALSSLAGKEDAVAPAKILVIDDDPLVIRALEKTLQREGYEVFTAGNGEEALALLETESIALIICDQRLPGMSGLDLLQQAQKMRPQAIRIALTGNNERETVINAINIGQVSQFISKPWEDAVLRQIVSDSLEKYRLSLENKNLHRLLLLQNKVLERANQTLRYEMQLGAQIHKELLFGEIPSDIYGMEVSATTVPSQEIDGDFFDFYHPIPHIVDIVIGDVMGKGIPAALVGTAIKKQLQRFALPLHRVKYCDRNIFWIDDLFSPKDVLENTHEEIVRQLIELEFFVSLFYGRFDMTRRTFTYVDCGSAKPIHYKAVGKEVRFLRGPDFPLGMVEKNNYHEQEAGFDDGDLFIFYSDGVTESRSIGGELYGTERLVSVVIENAGKKPEEVSKAIKEDVLKYAQKERFDDDLTLVVVKIHPEEGLQYVGPLSAAYLSDFSQLQSVRGFVKRVCDSAPGDPAALYQALELAVDEAFCNIVKHAYKGISGEVINLKAQYHQEGLWVELSDKGGVFNPQMTREPSLVGCEEGGYGLFIIRNLADQVAYLPKSEPEGWNHLRIYKRYIFKEVPMEFTHTTQDKVLVVTPIGPSLDAREAREFKDKVLALINQNATPFLVIDMSNLQFIDSSGLGTFLSILKTLHVQDGELKLANLNKPIRTIFELVSMHKIFEIYNTTEEAVLSFK